MRDREGTLDGEVRALVGVAQVVADAFAELPEQALLGGFNGDTERMREVVLAVVFVRALRELR